MGCCVNFSDQSISFTRNGIMLGVAFKGLKNLEQGPIYPIVGLRTPGKAFELIVFIGEVVQANFGIEPFKYDIKQYVRDERQKLWRMIHYGPSSQALTKSYSPLVNRLVMEYLVHQGYSETARVFYDSSLAQANDLDETGEKFEDVPGAKDIEQRRHVVELIESGHVEKAIQSIQSLYPSFLSTFPIVHAQLLCLQFVEMVRLVAYQTSSGDVPMTISETGDTVNLFQAILFSRKIKSLFPLEETDIHDAIDVRNAIF